MKAWHWSVALVVIYLAIPVLLYLLTRKDDRKPLSDIRRRKRTIVLVLGDLGRSPRMLYHARSLARSGHKVDLCGYDGAKPFDEILNNDLVKIHHIPLTLNTRKLPFVVFGILKVIRQHWLLISLLYKLRGADYLLVQNPPSIPTLGVVRFYNLFLSTGTKVVLDWHNFGYTILALKLPETHPMVKFAKFYEGFFGGRAFVHLCVTVLMGQAMRKTFGMSGKRIVPLHDRPAFHFKPLSESEKLDVLKDFKETLYDDMTADHKIIVSSTSYTPDENFNTLLDALALYDESKLDLPPLRVIITGKGPMMPEFLAKVEKLKMNKVSIRTAWLEFADYPRILGASHLGVSLHESSSGYDLPMKVVDMFGCGVPVVSVDYPALSELIKTNINGVAVKGHVEMGNTFMSLFSNRGKLDNIKRGAMVESRNTWDQTWKKTVGPLFGIGEYVQQRPDEDYDFSSSSSDDEH